MEKPPLLASFSPGVRFLGLILIIIISLLLTLFLGILISYPFYGTAIMNLGGDADFNDPGVISMMKYFQIISQFGFFIFPALIYAWVTEKNIGACLQIRKSPYWLSAVLTIMLLMFSLPLISWMLEVNQHMQLPASLSKLEEWMKQSEQSAEIVTRAFLATGSIGGFVVNLLMIAILPAVGEEFIFRGVLVRLFREWTKNKHLAILISAFLFSAMHMQFYGFFPRFMLGVLLGYLFVWSANLWIPVLAHFLNNVITVIAAFLFNRGIIKTNYEDVGTSVGMPELFFSITATIALLWFLYWREQQRRAMIRLTETGSETES